MTLWRVDSAIDLALDTVMNHQNTAAGAPCLSTSGTKNPADVLQGIPAIEHIKFKITLTKNVYEMPSETPGEPSVCKVSLTETVTATIRGLKFGHERWSEMPDRPMSDCK